ncbi:universal stress protein [Dyella sp. RRB7]|uniref:universal stress protein n=1 Tax=Dyella sp. RRB7 TaxID=2919502 RepID=UPI001FAAA39F|nr:universal stress protein [Dyella sp. RRB7]
MFKRILLPIDGSDQSLRAAAVGIDMATHSGASAVGLEILSPLAAVSLASDFIVHANGGYAGKAVEHAKEHLASLATIAREARVDFKDGYVFDHRPYTAIVAAANLSGCDLIVVGASEYAHGHRVQLSHEVVKLLGDAGVPVLVCH